MQATIRLGQYVFSVYWLYVRLGIYGVCKHLLAIKKGCAAFSLTLMGEYQANDTIYFSYKIVHVTRQIVEFIQTNAESKTWDKISHH